MFSQTLAELKHPPKGFEKEFERFPSRVKAQVRRKKKCKFHF
jgi:hypothetical protein